MANVTTYTDKISFTAKSTDKGNVRVDGWAGLMSRCHMFMEPDEARAFATELLDAVTAVEMNNGTKHIGGNAESCRACDSSNPPYPHICPGEDAA